MAIHLSQMELDREEGKTMTNMLDKAKAIREKLVEIRRTIHMNPEAAFNEHQTAALVSKTLTELGIPHETGVGVTGVVAHIGNCNGPTIGLRGDMDCVLMTDGKDVPYKSQVPGLAHTCGHDAHTAMLLGVAMLLKDEQIDGEVRLLFQPAEEEPDDEGFSGARRMIQDGAIEGMDAAIAFHSFGTVEAGKIWLKEGYILGNVDVIIATIKGVGGHAAAPHRAIDPIFISAQILNTLYAIPSRKFNPLEECIVSVGSIHGGANPSNIATEVKLEITLRSFTDQVREALIKEVMAALEISRTMGGDFDAILVEGYPAQFNDTSVVGWLRNTAEELIGAENIIVPDPMMNADDFAYISRASKGALVLLGVKAPGGEDVHVHHPMFDIDEDALPVGAAIMAETAMRFAKGIYK